MSGLLALVKNHRAAIRRHRDQKGDDRCWVDDYWLWTLLDPAADLTRPPPFAEAMDACRAFYEFRRADAPDPVPPDSIADPALWDVDLDRMDEVGLAAELARLQEAIRCHRAIGARPRTADDDRALYAVLPEKLPADFRLPPEPAFLGEARAPHAGCPSFWRSHEGCPVECHDLHRWGPCR